MFILLFDVNWVMLRALIIKKNIRTTWIVQKWPMEFSYFHEFLASFRVCLYLSYVVYATVCARLIKGKRNSTIGILNFPSFFSSHHVLCCSQIQTTFLFSCFFLLLSLQFKSNIAYLCKSKFVVDRFLSSFLPSNFKPQNSNDVSLSIQRNSELLGYVISVEVDEEIFFQWNSLPWGIDSFI